MNIIKTIEISNEEINLIEPMLTNSIFKPYRYISRGIEKKIIRFWITRIADSIKSNKSKAFAAESEDSIVGFILIGDLAWDSKFFNIPMASISEYLVDSSAVNKHEIARTLLKHALHWAKEKGYRFISCKTYTNDIISIHNLEQSGFLLVDTHLNFVIDFRKTPFNGISLKKPPEDVIIRLARPEDEQELVALAKAAFRNHFGRFHSDPRFSRKKATQVYMEWMSSSIKDNNAFFVLAEIDGRIAGLSVWKNTADSEKVIPIRISHYSIGAIHPDFFGRKLFTLLTYEGMKLLDGKTDIIEGPTHINNYPVHRGYRRLEWQISDAHHSFHKWLD